jgi:hypothetical protein
LPTGNVITSIERFTTAVLVVFIAPRSSSVCYAPLRSSLGPETPESEP